MPKQYICRCGDIYHDAECFADHWLECQCDEAKASRRIGSLTATIDLARDALSFKPEENWNAEGIYRHQQEQVAIALKHLDRGESQCP